MKTVAENNSIRDQFFLTRQSANLLEDFSREINRSSSLFLLYGDASVGKSRLLRELTNRGIPGRNFCWIDFKAGATGSVEQKNPADADDFVNDIQELMEAADEHDVIVVDHIELASNKAKHRLFHSWATEGIDKNINLIIAASTTGIEELRQFAHQFNIQIKSFQMMPCSMAEVEAFLAFYLFPTDALSSLSIPSDVEKQLRSCNGILSKVVEVANQQGELVSINTESEPESNSHRPLVIGLVLTILVAIGIGYQYQTSLVMEDKALPLLTEETITIVSDNEDVVSISQPEPKQSNSTVEADESIDRVNKIEQAQEAQPVSESIEQASVDDVSKLEPKPDSELAREDPVAEKLDEPEKIVVSGQSQQISRFHHDLDTALHWIENQEKSRATIQIMMIGFKNFDGRAYYSYLDSLASKNIDISRFKIYQTSINGSVVFGVIYGEYKNRREAYQGIRELPEVLKVQSPIPRTIGGIWNEINGR